MKEIEDLGDGLLLINLYEILYQESIGSRYNKKLRMRIQKYENLNIFLKKLKMRGIKLVGIGVEG